MERLLSDLDERLVVIKRLYRVVGSLAGHGDKPDLGAEQSQSHRSVEQKGSAWFGVHHEPPKACRA